MKNLRNIKFLPRNNQYCITKNIHKFKQILYSRSTEKSKREMTVKKFILFYL